jgi:hypothetical protein
LEGLLCSGGSFPGESPSVQAGWVINDPLRRRVFVFVVDGQCRAFALPGGDFANVAITRGQQRRCAQLAVDILPQLDDANCDISPP